MYITHRSFAAPAPASRDFFWLYTIHILYYVGVSIMPSRVLASGPKPCGGNNTIIIQYFIFTFPYYITFKDIAWLVTLNLLRYLMVKLTHINIDNIVRH